VEEDQPTLPEHAISSVAFRKIRVAQLLVFWVRVTNATFNNISVISWRYVLLVQETGVPAEKLLKFEEKLSNFHVKKEYGD
jgi:hypothetical protein